MHKQWNTEERKAQAAERKWRESYQAPARISGKHIFPIDPAIYAGVGGFKEIDKHPRHI